MPTFKIMTTSVLFVEEKYPVRSLEIRNHGHARRSREALRAQHLTGRKQGILTEIREQVRQSHVRFSARECPECHRPFCLLTVDGKSLAYCAHCATCWMYPTELKFFTHLERDIPSEECHCRPSRYACPVCRERMIEHVFLAPYTVTVDRCEHGHGIFLEDHVLERIFEIC